MHMHLVCGNLDIQYECYYAKWAICNIILNMQNEGWLDMPQPPADTPVTLTDLAVRYQMGPRKGPTLVTHHTLCLPHSR
jgi:hypothetical protein